MTKDLAEMFGCWVANKGYDFTDKELKKIKKIVDEVKAEAFEQGWQIGHKQTMEDQMGGVLKMKQFEKEIDKLIDYRSSEWGIINPLGLKSFIQQLIAKERKSALLEFNKEMIKYIRKPIFRKDGHCIANVKDYNLAIKKVKEALRKRKGKKWIK